MLLAPMPAGEPCMPRDTVHPVLIKLCATDWGEKNTPFKSEITLTNNSGIPVPFLIEYSVREDGILSLERSTEPASGQGGEMFANLPGPEIQVSCGEKQVTVPPGSTVKVPVSGSLDLPTGAYVAGFRISSPEMTRLLYKNYFIMPGELENVTEHSRFGVNGSDISYAGYHQRMGLGWVRFENLKWAFISPEKDRFAFDGSVGPWHVQQDRIIKEYTEKHNLNYLPYVFQTPHWSTTAPAGHNNSPGFPPEDFSDYGTAIFQIVARYGSKTHPADRLMTADKVSGMDLLRVIELWNEPNLNAEAWGPWVGSIEDFFEIFRIGAEAAKKADPDILVTSCGWAGIHLEDNIGQMSTYSYSDGKRPVDFTDILNVHYYSGRADPEIATLDPNVKRGADPRPGDRTFEDDLKALVSWWQEVRPGKPVWLTETGYDVGGPIGLDERAQAAKLPRVAMMALAAGIDKVFIYRESGSTPSMHAGAGFIRNDGSLRPSWFSYATLVRKLDGVEPGIVPRVKFPENEKIWGYVWERNGENVFTVWSLEEDTLLPLDLGECTVIDSFGRKRQLEVNNNLKIGIFPLYITIIENSDSLIELTRDRR